MNVRTCRVLLHALVTLLLAAAPVTAQGVQTAQVSLTVRIPPYTDLAVAQAGASKLNLNVRANCNWVIVAAFESTSPIEYRILDGTEVTPFRRLDSGQSILSGIRTPMHTFVIEFRTAEAPAIKLAIMPTDAPEASAAGGV